MDKADKLKAKTAANRKARSPKASPEPRTLPPGFVPYKHPLPRETHPDLQEFEDWLEKDMADNDYRLQASNIAGAEEEEAAEAEGREISNEKIEARYLELCEELGISPDGPYKEKNH